MRLLRLLSVAALVAMSLGATLPSTLAAPLTEPLGPVLAIGHRGASAYAPEHTFPAYDLALAMGVDMLECDLQLTRDEVLVCVHDTTVDRTSDGSGRVDEFTLAELRALDFGAWKGDDFAGAAIVPFEEQLDCYLGHDPRMRFHVETKGPDTYGGRMEELVAELLYRKGLIATGTQDIQTSTIVIQSFDPDSLRLIKDRAPSLPTAQLWPAASGSPTPALAETNALFPLGLLPAYADAAAPNSLAVTADPALVDRFHLNGHEVHTWTVNDDSDIAAVLDAGVDGVFTNNPDVLRAAIDTRGTGTTVEQRGTPGTFAPGCPGVAGRVTAPDGPGDIWRPAPGGRGVELLYSVADQERLAG